MSSEGESAGKGGSTKSRSPSAWEKAAGRGEASPRKGREDLPVTDLATDLSPNTQSCRDEITEGPIAGYEAGRRPEW